MPSVSRPLRCNIMKLGFVGTGSMTSAMVTGLRSSALESPSIFLSPRNSIVAVELAGLFPHVSITASNQDVLDQCETVVLAAASRTKRPFGTALPPRPSRNQHCGRVFAAGTFRIGCSCSESHKSRTAPVGSQKTEPDRDMPARQCRRSSLSSPWYRF